MKYTMLCASITESSLWDEAKETRILFVAMLARSDWNGVLHAALPGLARLANLTRTETEGALEILESPDPDSRDKAFDGRRVKKIEGGWQILNKEKYRAKFTGNRQQYMREYMKDYRKRDPQQKQEPKKTPTTPPTAKKSATPEEIEAIFNAYPRQVARGAAVKAIAKALKVVSFDELLAKVSEFANSPAGQKGTYTPHPATWFNAQRWKDDPTEWNRAERPQSATQCPQTPGSEFDRMAKELGVYDEQQPGYVEPTEIPT